MAALGGLARHSRPRRGRLTFAILVAVAVVAAACSDGAPGSPDAADERIPLVVDTDMGPDDVRALMMVATDPAIDLLAVTVSGNGLARCPAGAENAKAILEALGHETVPVACGAQAPIEGFNLAPTAWRDAADALAGIALPETTDLSPDGAVDLLTTTIGTATSPVHVLSLGPLTNLALAIEQTPELTGGIERLVVMGGAFDVGGNTLSFTSPPVAEFNIWFDPVAAARVFAADVDLTLIPLDATNDVPVTPMLHDAFADLGDDAPAAARLLGDHLAASPFSGGVYHWDDLAAAVLTNPELVVTEERRIAVLTDSGPDLGRTVVDPDGTTATVAVSADRVEFERRFADAFGLAELNTSEYEPDATVSFDGTTCRYDGPDPLPSELTIRVTNASDQPALGVSAGAYDPEATSDDLTAYWASQPTTPPWFLTISMIAPLSADTTSYWTFRNPPDTTLSCVYDLSSGTELAGPRLQASN